jgi:hypothetical protein
MQYSARKPGVGTVLIKVTCRFQTPFRLSKRPRTPVAKCTTTLILKFASPHLPQCIGG